jgi:hypothetical protein
MNVDRINHLKRILYAVQDFMDAHPEHYVESEHISNVFDLTYWVHDNVTHDIYNNRTAFLSIDDSGLVVTEPATEFDQLIQCGTTCCALGWACLDPHFQEEGLYIRTDADVPTFEDEVGCKAAATFFDISFDQATRVFIPESYEPFFEELNLKRPEDIQPKHVIDRINELLLQG